MQNVSRTITTSTFYFSTLEHVKNGDATVDYSITIMGEVAALKGELKARKMLVKAGIEDAVTLVDYKVETAKYTMSATDFIKNATKEA